jgi:hypothetical protein
MRLNASNQTALKSYDDRMTWRDVQHQRAPDVKRRQTGAEMLL